MANITPDVDLRGLVVPIFEALNATMTATSQAGAKPGGAVPTGTYPIALVTSGVLDQAMSEVEVEIQDAGGVATCTFRWRYDGDTLRSWDGPVAISGWEFIERTTGAGHWTKPHVVRDPRTGLLNVVATEDVGGVPSQIVVQVQDRFGKWSEEIVEDTGDETCGTLVPLPDGTMLCFYVYTVDTATTQIRMQYRKLGDTSWTLGSEKCLKTPLSLAGDAYVRIRAAYANGQILLLLHEADTADIIRQYVSTDLGGSLQSVETFSTSTRGYPDIAVYGGAFHVAYLEYDTTGVDVEPVVRTLASASLPLSSAAAVDAGATGGTSEWGTYAAGLFTSGECAIGADDDGNLWLFGRDHVAAARGEILTRVSLDLNETWTQNGPDMHNAEGTVVHWTGDTATYMDGLTVAPERGRMALVHTHVGSPTNDHASLMCAFLGGWSTVGMPENDLYPGRTGWGAWHVVYLPLDEPEVTGSTWTRTLTGAATASINANGLSLSAGAAETLNYTATPSSTPLADGILAEFHVTVTEGDWQHQVRISDGTNDYEATLIANATGLDLRDENGASIATATVDCTKGVVLRVALDKPSGAWSGNNGRVRAWYRVDGPYSGALVNYGPRADREWTHIGTSSSLVAGADTTARVYFGITNATASDSAVYRYVAFAGAPFHGGSVSPDNGIASSVNGQARGRVLPSALSPVHIAEGLRVHGVGGPARAGMHWTINSDYENPVTALDPARKPSPRITWRSTTKAVQQDIVWTGLDLGWRSGDLIAFCFENTNIGQCTMFRDTGGVSKVADIDFRVTGLGFTRSRGELRPNPGGANALFHFHEGALRGARAEFSGGVVRKIRSNLAGGWLAAGAAGTYPSARIWLDGYDAGDPSSGNFDLRMPGGIFITEAMAATDTLMLRIPVQNSLEDYYEIGTLLIGRVRIFQQYSLGRSLQWMPQYALTTSRSGARVARATGPMREAVDLAWDEGINTYGTNTPGTAPDHYTTGYSGADAIAAPADTPRTLAGILAETEGAVLPVEYLPAVKAFSAATTATAPARLIDPKGRMYGRILTETLRVDTVYGNENSDDRPEVVKVGQVRVEAEV